MEKEDHNPESRKIVVAIFVFALVVTFMLAMWFLSAPPSNNPPPTIAILEAKATSASAGHIIFEDVEPDVSLEDVAVYVLENEVIVGNITWNSNDPQDLSWNGASAEIGVNYVDNMSADSCFSRGDCMNFTGLSPGTRYSFNFLYIPMTSTMSIWPGNVVEFVTPTSLSGL